MATSLPSQRELELEELLSIHVKELKILKEKLPVSSHGITQDEMDGVKVLPSMVDPNTISPLITIYESSKDTHNNFLSLFTYVFHVII